MSIIEANVIIDVPDDVDISQVIAELNTVISSLNNRQTHINVIQIDDPLSLNTRTPKM